MSAPWAGVLWASAPVLMYSVYPGTEIRDYRLRKETDHVHS